MRTYSVKRGIDLRLSIIEKKEMATGDVTFLVNNSHTIVHVVFSWSEGGNFRERIPKWLKGTSDRYLEKFLVRRYDWLVQGMIPKRLIPPQPTQDDFFTRRSYRRYQNRRIK